MNSDDRYMLYALAAFAGILAFGTVSYSYLEGWSPLDSLYFSLFSVLTIGFGDIVPSPARSSSWPARPCPSRASGR